VPHQIKLDETRLHGPGRTRHCAGDLQTVHDNICRSYWIRKGGMTRRFSMGHPRPWRMRSGCSTNWKRRWGLG